MLKAQRVKRGKDSKTCEPTTLGPNPKTAMEELAFLGLPAHEINHLASACVWLRSYKLSDSKVTLLTKTLS